MRRPTVQALALALLLCVVGPASVGEAAGETAAELSFLTGRWVGEAGGALIEEWWMAPQGGALLGMFRVVADGRPVLYEVLLVEDAPDGARLRLKHVGPDLSGREEKGPAAAWRLVSLEGKKAVWEQPGTGTRLSYERAAPDRLVAVLLKTKDGKPTREEFAYRLVP